jgi:hypothetical protein
MRQVACALVVLACSFAQLRAAHACSCGLSSASYPVDGDTRVPTDVEVAVEQDGFGAPPVLQTQAGVPVEVEMRTSESRYTRWYLLRPVMPLKPGVAYEVVSPVRETIRFTVVDRTARSPGSAVVTALQMGTASIALCPNRTNCHPASEYRRTSLAFTPATDVAYYELVLSAAGKEPWTRLLPPDFYGVIDNSLCSEDSPVLEPGAQWCAELVAVGFDGGRTAGTQLCTEIVGCGDSCDEEVEACLSADFEVGPEEVPAESSGCRATQSPASAAWLMAILWLGLRRSRRRVLSRRHCRRR